MRRREFITLIGGATAWSIAARAQNQNSPVIGFLSGASAKASTNLLTEFRRGLNGAGYIEGINVAIEYRWAEGQYERLRALAADLVERRVAVIVVAGGGVPAALAAHASTSTIPIVAGVGADPVQLGLVASLNRPDGNITGLTNFVAELGSKQLGLLQELVPKDSTIGLLVNPKNQNARNQMADVQVAARAVGRGLLPLSASTEGDIDGAFEIFARHDIGALILGTDAFLRSRRDQIVALAARYAIVAVYPLREFSEAGGLMSYGPDVSEFYRQLGVYTARILKGEKPADLPVMRSTKFELVINLKAARMVGLTVPLTLLAIADEVIE